MAAVWPINLRPPCGGRTAKRCKRRSGKWRTRANGGHARPVFFVGCVGGVVHLFRVVGPEVDVAALQVVGPEIDVAALQVRCSIVSSASFWGRSWAGLWPSCWCRVLRRFGLALVVGFALICLHQQPGLAETVVASMPVAICKFLLAQWDASTDWQRPWLRPCQLPFASFCSPSGTPPPLLR